VKALEKAGGADLRLLRSVAAGKNPRRGAVGNVRDAYVRAGAVDAASREIDRLTRRAKKSLGSMGATPGGEALLAFADRLADRSV
jgi:geranylgeranyl pyrophosphate synthase